MKELLSYIIEKALAFREFAGGILGPALPVLFTISFVLSFLLVAGIIMLILRSGWFNYKYDYYTDYWGLKGTVSRRRQLRAWVKIVKLLRTEDPENWKKAVLAADEVLDEVFKASGYKGVTADERFQQVTGEVLANIGEIQQAHQVRDRIAKEAEFTPTKAEIVEVIRVYQRSFKQLGLLD